MGHRDMSTIERFMAIQPEDRIEYLRNASGGLVGSPPQRELATPARASRGWAKVVGYSAIVFVCGLTLGYGMRAYSPVPAAATFADAASDPALLRIDYDLRAR